MPIDLNQMVATASAPKKLTPKFFSTSLTGNGQTQRGWLSSLADPEHIHLKSPCREEPDMQRRTIRQTQGGDSTTVRKLPLYMVPAHATQLYRRTMKWAAPDFTRCRRIGTFQNTGIYIDAHAHSIHMEEIENTTSGVHEKRLLVFYRLGVWICDDAKIKPDDPVTIVHPTDGPKLATVRFLYSVDVTEDLNTLLKRFEKHNAVIDWDDVYDFISNMSAYELIVEQAELWHSDKAAKELEHYVDAIVDDKGNLATGSETAFMLQLRALEAYAMPLHVYTAIYQMLANKFNGAEMRRICKVNLNLLLANTMADLDTMKPNLKQFIVPNPAPVVDPKFTREQVAAITSNDPLILTQAAAGSGKSTVVLERLRFMNNCGVSPEDTTVLSFTNAAADHITELNPDVNSMTIAKMVHMIYSENYEHRLSTLETVRNALSIYFPNDPVAHVLRQRLFSVAKNDTGAFTELNLFVEDHFDRVIELLNGIGQTTLELEIIVTYQNIDNMVEPNDVTCEHLLIDEVQDCSIFEFIFALDYTKKHKNSMFLVGDASQTLYEFRAANPRALNVMEASQVFTTFPLQVNFRSNQEILDTANTLLSEIDANSYAKLRLQANSLAKPTPQSLADKVHISYIRVSKQSEARTDLEMWLEAEAKTWVEAKLKAGEQVCFLAYQNAMVKQAMNWMEKTFPTTPVMTLVSEKTYPSTVLSNLISRYQDELTMLPIDDKISVAISNFAMSNLENILGRRANIEAATPGIATMLADWRDRIRPLATAWAAQYKGGIITAEVFFGNVFGHMLDFEIERNDRKQVLMSARNAERKRNHDIQSTPLLVSTIHSAKGLEFDNTIILFQDNKLDNEETKRLQYVALTRAKKAELVIAYDKLKSSALKDAYKTVYVSYGGDPDDLD